MFSHCCSLVQLCGNFEVRLKCQNFNQLSNHLNFQFPETKFLSIVGVMTSEKPVLQLLPVTSFVQPSFWTKLTELKLNVDKLDETVREIWGFFPNIPTTWTTPLVEVDSTSFNVAFNLQNNSIPFHGKIFNKNTIEQFKDCDKTQLINEEGRKFLDLVKSGKILEEPSKLNFFIILSFGDLKHYHFFYWFAFPVPYDLPVKIESNIPLTEKFSQEMSDLSKKYLELNPHQRAYFLIHNNEIYSLKCKIDSISESNYESYYFAFAELGFDKHPPKSQLKNYIIFLLHYCPFLGGKKVNFISFSLDRKLSCDPSQIYELVLPENKTTIDDLVYKDGQNVWAGWEKNENNKFGPRFVNMKTTMDPQVLYQESVDLNLKLMKWQMLPDIDLDKIKNIRCLLIGAGTLGCSIARNLLGWGVRNFTFIDNSTVSYSNPVRQHLYTYDDAIAAKPKATAAAENLRKIFPLINCTGHQLTVPMPGHSVGKSTLESVKKNVDDLTQLIQQHDVIFLLTDSRESRWLPTLLGVHFNKIVINVALGFDSYLIMRYGSSDNGHVGEPAPQKGIGQISGNELGCYFCNDVTAPGNSMKGRTLDQQCTVTRAGVSSVAGALAVELAISVVAHSEGVNAPAFYHKKDNSCEFGDEHMGILGVVPHSIRGFLSTFSQVLPATPKYNKCIACSSFVVEEYRKKEFDFLLEAFNSSAYLENLTGLTAMFSDLNYEDVLEMNEDEWL